MMEADRQGAGRLLRRLAWVGIVLFLVISAFDIHRWRVDAWQAFDANFTFAKAHIFGIPPRPNWLYLVAFPFVAVNFYCHVQLVRGKRAGLLKLFLGSAAGIALMPLAGLQGVLYRIVWPDILTLIGYANGGAIAMILAYGLDRNPASSNETRDNRND